MNLECQKWNYSKPWVTRYFTIQLDELLKLMLQLPLYLLKKSLTCDLTSGMFIRASSVFDLALDLTSHSPALCWGKKQWTKWIFVRLNCSHNPSTWNLTCNATELRLMPACPLVNVRRMEDMRRRLWLPSRPATDPDKEVIGPRLVRKRSDIAGLLDSCMRNK